MLSNREFFLYPIKAIRELQKEHIRAWPVVMEDLFAGGEIENLKNILKKENVKGDVELEVLEKYPRVLKNMAKRWLHPDTLSNPA